MESTGNSGRYKLVALVGRPNVGKSTLFNRLTKSRKAIVDPTPGVTRDRHYDKVTWEERSFILVDTGGLEMGDGKGFAGLIREQTELAIKEADIILFMLDGKEGLTTEDFEVAELLRKTDKTIFYLANKVDGPELESELSHQFYELGIDNVWPVSSSHGYGVRTFMDELATHLTEEAETRTLPEDTIRIACLGRPNVGKSSLINKLLGEDRMVVSDVPGTTRDSVDTLLERKGKHYLLIDTAGIRRKGKVKEKIEKFSVMRALSALEHCDLVLLLVDATEGITEQDTNVLGYCIERGRACLILVNKWDLVKDDKKRQKWILDDVERATGFAGFAPVLTISALTGKGVGRIFSEVGEVYGQFCKTFATNRLNKVLQSAVEGHTPSLHKGRRIKMYYVTQAATRPPTFLVFVNYPKGVHFSYFRYLVNKFREGLALEKSPIKIVLKERARKKYPG